MFDETRSLITGMIKSMLPRFSTTRFVRDLPEDVEVGDLGLRFRLRLDLNYFGERTDFTDEQREKLADRYLVEFIVTRRNNYTQVYYRHGTFREMPETWTFAADHDSCWRSAFDVLATVYFDRREPFLEAGLKYHEISERGSFDLSGDPQYVILLDKEAIGDEQERYARMRLPHKLTYKSIPFHKIFPYLRKYQQEVGLIPS
jgi:hypothetical protein